MKTTLCLWTLSAILASGLSGPVAQGRDADALAKTLAESAGLTGGFCVVIGVGDARLPAALARQGAFVVHGLEPRAAIVAQVRERIAAEELCARVSISAEPIHPLPYTDHLVNLAIVSSDAPAADPSKLAKELFRILAPGGTAYVAAGNALVHEAALTGAGLADVQPSGAWIRATKPRPAAMDEWTHARYGPENTATSRDRLAGPPRTLRWVYGPHINQHHGGGGSSVAAAVTAQGLLYQVLDLSPPFFAAPSDHRLVARDAFSGVTLWEKPVQVGRLRGSGGQTLNRGLQRPGHAMAVRGDILYTILDNTKDQRLRAIHGKTGAILREYADTSPDATILAGDNRLLLLEQGRIRLLRENDGSTIWTAEVGSYGNRMVSANGRVYCHVPRRQTLLCLDLESGKELWKQEKRSGILQGHVRGTLVLVQGRDILGLSAENGNELWEVTLPRSGRAPAAWATLFADGLVWAATGSRATGERHWVGLNPKTGKEERKWATRFDDKCAPSRATDRYLIPSRLILTDTQTGAQDRSVAARGACAFGVLPANGMLYTFPMDCQCATYLIGTMGFGPENGFEEIAVEERTEHGPAFGYTGEAKTDSRDWPVYRANPQRSGASLAQPSASPALRWTCELPAPLSPPSFADGRVFVASPEQRRVHAVRADNGQRLWSFATDGRVISPPSIEAGLAVFGCRNGWVYAVRADNGHLVWRTRVAPAARLVMAYGQPESAWPVEGSLLVADGIVYGSCGRHTELDGGARVFALNLADGRFRWQEPASNTTFADMLVMENDWLFMNRAQHHKDTGKPPQSRYHRIGDPTFRAGQISAFRQESFAPRAQWHLSGVGRAPIMVFDEARAAGVHVFDNAKTSVFRPAETGYKLWLRNRAERAPVWETASAIKPEAMALTPERLYIAGSEDAWPPSRWSLRVHAAADGKLLSELALAAPPVFDGLIAAQNSLVLSSQNGALTCFE